MTDTERVEEATRSFLDDYPDATDALAELVDVDADGPWTFEDVSMDSGRFGELVSRDIARKTDGAYRLADREVVRAVLRGETVTTDSEETATRSLPTVDVNWRVLVALVGGLALVVGVRSLYVRRILRDGHVVSPGNDPYYYRYWQEQMLAQSTTATDLGMLTNVPGDGRAITHLLNWWVAAALGGTQDAAATVAAWAPIVSAVVIGVLVYWLAVTVTRDERIALASVFLLALTPVHAIYTTLGFLEHRSYQYVALLALVGALAWLAADLRRRYRGGDGRVDGTDADGRRAGQTDTRGRRTALSHVRAPETWLVAVLLALGTFVSVHVWSGSPITFGAVALYLALRVAMDERAGIPAHLSLAPTLAGLGVGAGLGLLAHLRVGWHGTVEATIPLLVVAGGVALVALAVGWRRVDLPTAWLLGGEVAAGLVGAGLYWLVFPEHIARLTGRAGDLFGREEVSEAVSLFDPGNGVIFTPLFQLGVSFYLALVALLFLTWLLTREYEPGWLVLVSVGWYYLAFATVQIRFAAHLSMVTAVLGGAVLVAGLARLDLARPTALFADGPSRPGIRLPETPTVAGALVGVVGLVVVLNLVFLPGLVGGNVYDEKFDATLVIMDHAEESDRELPATRVLSHWGDSRMHNYFLNGESRDYSHALRNHEAFITAEDPDANADSISAGYAVLTDRPSPEGTVHYALFHDRGAGEDSPGRFQLLYDSPGVRAFAVVDGATLVVDAGANETVTATTEVTTAGQTLDYRPAGVGDENGTAAVRVAYPGTYEVGGETVTVTEADVRAGEQIEVGRVDD